MSELREEDILNLLEEKSEPKEDKVKPSDWLNFSSAVIVVVATSILYYSGWQYTSTWFSFFGLDLSAMEIPASTILVNGTPGLLFTVGLFIIALLFSMTREVGRSRREKMQSRLPNFTVSTLMVAGFFGGFLMFVLLIELVMGLFGHSDPTFNMRESVSMLTALAVIPFFYLLLGIGFVSIHYAGKIITRSKVKFEEDLARWNGFLEDFAGHNQAGVIILLIVYFFTASFSSIIIGEMDAHSGRHLTTGWYIPRVTVTSEESIQILSGLEQDSSPANLFVYGPLGLVYQDANNYYLADWSSNGSYKDSPLVYIVPRAGKVALIVEPKVEMPVK